MLRVPIVFAGFSLTITFGTGKFLSEGKRTAPSAVSNFLAETLDISPPLTPNAYNSIEELLSHPIFMSTIRISASSYGSVPCTKKPEGTLFASQIQIETETASFPR